MAPEPNARALAVRDVSFVVQGLAEGLMRAQAEDVAVKRALSDHERALLRHLLSGNDPLSLALRDRVERAVVLQDTVDWASIHLWAGEENLEALTGGSPRRAVAAWRQGPTQIVSLTIAEAAIFRIL